MRNSKKVSVLIIAFAAAFAITALSSSARAADPKPKDLWEKSKAKWNTVNTYACQLLVWNYRTQTWLKNNKCDGDCKQTWNYRIFNIKFKKPDKVILSYQIAKNEDLVNGSLIDISMHYVLTYIPGTTFYFGQMDKKQVYIIFPYISDRQFNALPVPAKYKAGMKLLMVASRKEYYHQTPSQLKDNRNNLLNETSIGIKMKQFEHYFSDGTVTIAASKLPVKADYALNESTGYVTAKAPSGKSGIYKLTMVPKNAAKNKGVTKAEVFVDSSNNMLVGFHEYEGNKLVQVVMFLDLKLDTNISDADWTAPFKGRTLSDKK